MASKSLLTLLIAVSSASASMWPSSQNKGSMVQCPELNVMPDFDLQKFLGDWYVLEYEYPQEKKLKDLSCVGFHFGKTSFGDIMSNFTFRFPAETGHFYHVPTFSSVVEGNQAVWSTLFKGVELISGVLDTDYSRWAVFTQCKDAPEGPAFLSTRILSRTRYVSPSEWMELESIVKSLGVDAPFKYSIKQDVCQEIDGDNVV